MSSNFAYAEGLSDEALYKELKRYGFPAGPVVASTRNLYRRKLIEILENQEKHSDEKPETYDEPTSSQLDNSRWSHFTTSSSPHQPHEQEEVSSVLNSSYSSPIYRRYGDDDATKSRFSYFDYQDAAHIPLSKDSTSYPFRKSLSGVRNDDSFSRMRTHTDTQSRPELSPRYRLPGFSEEQAARMARHSRGQSKRSRRLIICGALVLAAVLVLYILYNVWSESDPYYQIEEEAKKLIEESDT